MLDTLQKMSGTTHKAYRDTKAVTRDVEKLWMPNDGKVTITVSVKERPVITYNDMAFIAERNSIVFRAGDSPIWNRNQLILPMSWRLFQNTITVPGKEYSLQTIPTLSSAMDFDVRKNQPDFIQMWEKRREQARMAGEAMTKYQEAYGYTDYQIAQLDPDNYADDIMSIINAHRASLLEEAGAIPGEEKQAESEDDDDDDDYDMDDIAAAMMGTAETSEELEYEDNTEIKDAIRSAMTEMSQSSQPRYAGGMLSRDDLIGKIGGWNKQLDSKLIRAFRECKAAMFQDIDHFMEKQGSLVSGDGYTVYIRKKSQSSSYREAQEALKQEDAKVYSDETEIPEEFENTYVIELEFIRFLCSLDNWDDLAGGKFEAAMAKIMREE